MTIITNNPLADHAGENTEAVYRSPVVLTIPYSGGLYRFREVGTLGDSTPMWWFEFEVDTDGEVSVLYDESSKRWMLEPYMSINRVAGIEAGDAVAFMLVIGAAAKLAEQLNAAAGVDFGA